MKRFAQTPSVSLTCAGLSAELQETQQHQLEAAHSDTLVLFLFPQRERVACGAAVEDRSEDRRSPVLRGGPRRSEKDPPRSKEIRQTERDVRAGSRRAVAVAVAEERRKQESTDVQTPPQQNLLEESINENPQNHLCVDDLPSGLFLQAPSWTSRLRLSP